MTDFEAAKKILAQQKTFYRTGGSLPLSTRKSQLKKLRQAIKKWQPTIEKALWQDLHKSAFEAYATEIGLVYDEIDRHLRYMGRWARPHRRPTPLSNFKARSFVLHEPYGHTLIMAPWNYPFQLLILPLVGAISAGNVVALKPSELTPNTAQTVTDMITETFASEYVSCFTGDLSFNQQLVKEPWDFIFFTGSPRVGKIIMRTAADRLTPVVLELGGKSPVIVDEDAHLKLAARRIAWGKFLNAGQTCIAPDYLLVHHTVREEFLRLLQEQITRFFGDNPQDSPDLPRISTQANVERLQTLIGGSTVYAGGQSHTESRYVAPTLLYPVKTEDAVMQQEIFGPILPVIEFNNLQQALQLVNQRPKPLALYYFSRSKQKARQVLQQTSSGGAAINEVIMHIANPKLPFGGVGPSGMGRYHGKRSFTTFSNERSVLSKATWIDVPLRYPPYTKQKLKWIKKLL